MKDQFTTDEFLDAINSRVFYNAFLYDVYKARKFFIFKGYDDKHIEKYYTRVIENDSSLFITCNNFKFGFENTSIYRSSIVNLDRGDGFIGVSIPDRFKCSDPSLTIYYRNIMFDVRKNEKYKSLTDLLMEDYSRYLKK